MAHKLDLEIDVPGLVAWRVGIGDVRRYQLLPFAQQIHVPFNTACNRIQHFAGVTASRFPTIPTESSQLLSALSNRRDTDARRKFVPVCIAAVSFWKGADVSAADPPTMRAC